MHLKSIAQLILEASKGSAKYGCLMLFFDYDKDKLKKLIDKEDLCEAEGGFEDESHVTLLYGFHDDVEPKAVLNFIEEKGNLSSIKSIPLVRLSLFKNKDFEVLKFDVMSSELNKLNKLCTKNFKYTNKYPEYKAHATVAYLMPGTGEKYLKKFANMKFEGKPTKMVFSDKDKNKSSFKL